MRAGCLLCGTLALCCSSSPYTSALLASGNGDGRQAYPADGRSFIYLAASGVDDPQEGFTGRLPLPVDAPADGGPRSRVLLLSDAPQGQSSIDDVTLKIKMLLAMARSLQATPVIGPPSALLRPPAAPWWDSYLETSPQLRRREEVRCAGGLEPVLVNSPGFFGEASPEVLGAMRDHSQPLCLELGFLIFLLRPDFGHITRGLGLLEYELLVKPTWGQVQIWRSGGTLALVDKVRKSLLAGLEAYDSLHVRRGDLAANCTAPARVVQRMLQLGSASFWVVLSNAEKEWFSDFRQLAASHGLAYVTEEDVPALKEIEDPYLRYAVVECLYAQGGRRIHTIKSLVKYCHPPGRRLLVPEAEEGRLCSVTGPPERSVLVEA